MLARYVVADLVRNPRRTLSTMVGVALGVGLFCGVLFFVDGLSASMTQRALAPLAIDMQRIVTEDAASSVALTQRMEPAGPMVAGDRASVLLEIRNAGEVPANEVTVRSLPGQGMDFVPGSATVGGDVVTGVDDNPFDHGAGSTGLNIGTLMPGEHRRLSYVVDATTAVTPSDVDVATTFSSRESVDPTPANAPPPLPLDRLAELIGQIDGVDHAEPLSFADLGSDTLRVGVATADGPAKIFGFDERYTAHDDTIAIVDGALTVDGVVLSAEAAGALDARVGDTVAVALPDGSTLELPVSGVADLSRSRSLFSSRRGGDLETFIYVPSAVIVSPATFADVVQPAYDRAATSRGSRLKSPPAREVDIGLRRDSLDADPASAAVQTQRVGDAITAVAADQDYLLDNISNTLDVAAADARVAKRLFVFLGVPGGFLAAILAAYAGTVLAEAQRREQATLRIRGASRRHLARMLALRTGLLTAAGSAVGLVAGYLAAMLVLGRASLSRASTVSLVGSGLIGAVVGFVATGAALYFTGRRSIDSEINEDRAQLTSHPPLWRRARVDLIGIAVVVVATVIARRAHAFDGRAGSVYFGRAVELDLPLLVLPIAAWIAGSLVAGRLLALVLRRYEPPSTTVMTHPRSRLLRLSVTRRPWAISNGAVVVSLIVALASCLAAFTASYDAAKIDDARFANGADIRITPNPTAARPSTIADTGRFQTAGVEQATPVIYAVSNVILRSDRTSDPANLAAIDPRGYAAVAPVEGADFRSGDARTALDVLVTDPHAVLVSEDMAAFLKARPGDTLHVLLARATADQVEIELRIAGLFRRLPGFPDGADAVMSIAEHTTLVPTKIPDFFLASAAGGSDRDLQRTVESLPRQSGLTGEVHIDTRVTTLGRDQSSLAALNIAGLGDLDAGFALSMAVVTVAIFVFALLLQRRREYVTLRAQGLDARSIRRLIAAEAGILAVGGSIGGLVVGTTMGYYFVHVLRPLFVLQPRYEIPARGLATPILIVAASTLGAAIIAARLVDTLDPTELLRDD